MRAARAKRLKANKQQAEQLLGLALDTFPNGEAAASLDYIERLLTKALELLKNKGDN
jgi:hypothetical protein